MAFWKRTTQQLGALLGRYPLGKASFEKYVPALTDELVQAQRAGRLFAFIIVRDYTDLLYAATEDAIGTTRRTVRHSLLAPAGRIMSETDAAEPAVPLVEDYSGQPPFNHYHLGDGEVHPHIHLAAAVRAQTGARSVEEAGGPAELPETLDRAWFLLAYFLNISLGRGKMFDPDRNLIIDLIAYCARLHQLSGVAEPPAFVRDAADRDLTLRQFVHEWVTTRRYVTTDGETINEGHPETWDSGLRLPVGSLLRERFGGAPVTPADPAAAMAIDLDVAERSCRELIAILVQYDAEKGSVARTRVVAIGEELNALGGMDLMFAVHRALTVRRRDCSRRLDLLWDGIGQWRG